MRDDALDHEDRLPAVAPPREEQAQLVQRGSRSPFTLRTNVGDVRDAEHERDRLAGLEEVERDPLVDQVAEAVDLVRELVLVDLGVVVELREARVEHLADERELLLRSSSVRMPHLEPLGLDALVVEREELLDGRSRPRRGPRATNVSPSKRRSKPCRSYSVGVVGEVVRAVDEPALLVAGRDDAAGLVGQQVDGPEQALGSARARPRLERGDERREDLVVVDELGEAEQEMALVELRVELGVRVRRRAGDDRPVAHDAQELDARRDERYGAFRAKKSRICCRSGGTNCGVSA